MAVKSSEETRTSKCIKWLLIYGADRNMKDDEGNKPIDFVKYYEKYSKDTKNAFILEVLNTLVNIYHYLF